MITASVNLVMQASTSMTSTTFNGKGNDHRRTYTSTSKEGIRANVRQVVRQSYGAACAAVAFQMEHQPAAVRSLSADGVRQVLEETQHIAHIEYSDGTSEALIVEVDMSSVANAGCANLVYTHFNEGKIGS